MSSLPVSLAAFFLAFSTTEAFLLTSSVCNLQPYNGNGISISENTVIHLDGSYNFYTETIEAMLISKDQPGIAIFTPATSSNNSYDNLYIAGFGAEMTIGDIFYLEMSPTDHAEQFYCSSNTIKALFEERNISADDIDFTHILQVTWWNVSYDSQIINFQIVLAKTTSNATYALLLYHFPYGIVTNGYNVTVGFNAGNGQLFENRLHELLGDANACKNGACVFRIDTERILPEPAISLSFDQPTYTVGESESTVITLSLNHGITHDISVNLYPVPTQHLQLVSSLPPTVYHVTFPASSVPQTQSFTLSALSDNALYEPDEVIHFDIYCTPDRMILDVPSSRLTVLIQDGNRPACPKPPELENGYVTVSDESSLQCVATYHCNSGYKMVGQRTLTCPIDFLANQCDQWPDRVPTCNEGLTLRFIENTPFVSGTFAMAKFEANRDNVEVTCRLHYRRRWHSSHYITIRDPPTRACTIARDGMGKTVGVYVNRTMTPAQELYRLIIKAKHGKDRAVLRGNFRVYSENIEECYCGVHMINTLSNPLSTVKTQQRQYHFRDYVEFAILGNDNVTCTMDGVPTECGCYEERAVNFETVKVCHKNIKEFPIGRRTFFVAPSKKPPCYFNEKISYKFDLIR